MNKVDLYQMVNNSQECPEIQLLPPSTINLETLLSPINVFRHHICESDFKQKLFLD